VLIDRILEGDAAAEDELAVTYQRKIFVILLGRISDPETARELSQDVLIAVLDAIKARKVREPERLAAFIHGVARNLANNHIRSRSSGPQWVELQEEAVWLDGEEAAEMADRKRRLMNVIAGLEPVDRTVLTLSIVQGLSSREVAAATGLSDEATRARKSRAIKRVAEQLRDAMSQRTAGSPPTRGVPQ
jgi:RNA polymerase sigma factor (sigma-70 family)